MVFGADDAAVVRHLRHELFPLLFAAHDGGGIHYRIGQRLVAGAAAGVAVTVEPGAHVFPRRVLVLVEQRLGRHDEAGRADAALGAAMVHPGNLQRVQVVGRADAFDGDDLFAVGELADRDHAGLDRFIVDEDGTGAALAVVTADLAAGE